MLDRLIHALIESKNEASDDLLVEALGLGSENEKEFILRGLLARKTLRGLTGVIELFDQLPERLQVNVLSNIREFHHSLRECGRSDRHELRLAAMKLIALGRQGKLAFVLSENLHDLDEALSKAATEAIVALARWVAVETRRLQKSGFGSRVSGFGEESDASSSIPDTRNPTPETRTAPDIYRELIDNRPDIEAAVARAMDVHRGRHG